MGAQALQSCGRPERHSAGVAYRRGCRTLKWGVVFHRIRRTQREQRHPLPHASARGIALARLHSRRIPNTTMRLCRRTATGGALHIEMAREHGMAPSPDPMDAVYRTFMAELRVIHDRTALARRFHQLMGQCTHLEMPVQYERLYLRSLAQHEEPSNDDPRGRQHRRRRRLPHSRV